MKDIMQQSYSRLLDEEYKKNKMKPQKGGGWVENKVTKDKDINLSTMDPWALRSWQLKNNPLKVEYEDELKRQEAEFMMGKPKRYKFL